MKSERFTSSAACWVCWFWMRSVPRRMLPPIVPEKRKAILKDDAEAAAEIGKVHIFDVDAVDASG